MDTEHYVQLSDRIMGSGGLGVPENDDLEGSRTGLRTGYGQTKWVCEKLIMEAGRRGLKAHIVRPGYVVGHSKTAGEFTFDVARKLFTFSSYQHGRLHLEIGQGMHPVAVSAGYQQHYQYGASGHRRALHLIVRHYSCPKCHSPAYSRPSASHVQ